MSYDLTSTYHVYPRAIAMLLPTARNYSLFDENVQNAPAAIVGRWGRRYFVLPYHRDGTWGHIAPRD